MKPRIKYGLLWFQIIIMNIGLICGTVGLILQMIYVSPLIETGIIGISAGMLYLFFYCLLVVGVIGIDYLLKKNGIEKLCSMLME